MSQIGSIGFFMISVLLFASGFYAGLFWSRRRANSHRDQDKSEEALRERVKELNCLYAVADLIEKEGSLEKLFQGSAETLAQGWLYPELACARITFKGRQYQTGNFRVTDWRQSAPLKVDGQPAGMIELCYLEERPTRDEGPFLQEERNLINAIAGRLGKVAERKQTEEKLRQAADRLALATRVGGVGIWDYDVVANRLIWDDEMFRLYGITREQFGGAYEAWCAGVHPEDRKRGDEEIQRALRAEKDFNTEFRVLWPDGSIHDIRAIANVERDATGKALRMIGTNWDITERKRTEEKLRQLSRAVEQSPASIVITDPAGNIEYVNPKFMQVTGYTLAEALGNNPRILKSGEKSPEAYRELWQTIAEGKEWHGEFHNRKKNGELYWESASISPIRDPDGRVTHYVAVKEDITARKQTEAERDQLIRDLQNALANVKSLSGLLPICAGCKKIRDDKGYWNQVEGYIQKHSEARFSHGMCPDCMKKWYPNLEQDNPQNP
jgi:PAS domain S-box-containing protein